MFTFSSALSTFQTIDGGRLSSHSFKSHLGWDDEQRSSTYPTSNNNPSLTDFNPADHRGHTRQSTLIDAESDTIVKETTEAMGTVCTSDDHFSFNDYGLISTPVALDLNKSEGSTNRASSSDYCINLTGVNTFSGVNNRAHSVESRAPSPTAKLADRESFYTPSSSRNFSSRFGTGSQTPNLKAVKPSLTYHHFYAIVPPQCMTRAPWTLFGKRVGPSSNLLMNRQ